MNEYWMLILTFFTGIFLGTVFFGGLWWTVVNGLTAKQPVLWFGSSIVIRTSRTLIGFYLVSGEDWQRMVICLLGFIIARFIITRLSRMPLEKRGEYAP